jgi:large subunit ribosomal protein L14
MLQKETKISTLDNTGVKLLKCIHINSNKKYAFVGDLLSLVVNKFRSKKKLKKKQIYYGLLVNSKFQQYREEGIYIVSDKNKVVLLSNENYQFLGTRIYGPIYKEIINITEGKKKIRYEKIISLAKKLI